MGHFAGSGCYSVLSILLRAIMPLARQRKTAIVLTNLLAIALLAAGIIRIFNAFIFKAFRGWGWTLFSGILTLATGILFLLSPNAPFWVLGRFSGNRSFVPRINYLTLASYIKHRVPKLRRSLSKISIKRE